MLATLFFINTILFCSYVSGFHDSLNFVLPPKTRQCFYENFEPTSPTRTIEAFVQSGGNADVWLVQILLEYNKSIFF